MFDQTKTMLKRVKTTIQNKKMTEIDYRSHLVINGLHPLGPRKYGIAEEGSDYDFLLIIPESKAKDILPMWEDADIIEYSSTPDLSAMLPVNAGYRIKGIANENTASYLSIPTGVHYDILVITRPDKIPDSNFILTDISLYSMISMDDITSNTDFKSRFAAIRKWAKSNNVYGGVYPGGTGYIIYTLNTLRKGYSLEKSLKMLSNKCLYYSDVYKYKHVSYVSDRSFRHMENIIRGRVVPGSYQYSIRSKYQEEVLQLAKKLLDTSLEIQYISNEGIIHASSDISDDISKWSEWIFSLGLDVRVIEMK